MHLDFAARLALVYAVFAGLWLGLAEAVAKALLPPAFLDATGPFLRAAPFVFVTAGFLYVLLRREAARRSAIEAELRESHERLERSEADYRSIMENLPDVFYRIGVDGRVEMVSPFAAESLGYDMCEVIGRPVAELYAEPEGRDKFLAALNANGGHVHNYQMALRHRNGTSLWASVNACYRFDGEGRVIGIDGIARDITQLIELQEQLRFLASHDSLTGLCNRALFGDRLDHALARARRDGTLVALLFIDLDGFKEINDSRGHQMGDRLLQEVAQRLRGLLRESDTLARMGGDEFAVLIEGLTDAAAVAGVTEKIVTALGRPILVGGAEMRVSASVGAAVYPADAEDGTALLQAADHAMYAAKAVGKNRASGSRQSA